MSARVAPAHTPLAFMTAIEKRIMAWPPPPPPAVSIEDYDPAKSLSNAHPQCRRVKDGVRVKLKPKPFSELNARFRSKLARLTLPRLTLTRRPESPSRAEAWTHWESIAGEWATQACFLPGDPEFWNIGLAIEQWQLQYVGRLIVFSVSNVAGNPDERKSRAWKLQRAPIDAQYPISEKKSCPCIFLRVPRGAVDWDELRALSLSDENNPAFAMPPQMRDAMKRFEKLGGPALPEGSNKHPATPLQHLLHLIAIRCHGSQSPYAVISDGETSFFADMKFEVKDEQLSSATLSGELIPEATYPAIYLLLATISELSPSLAERPVRTLGALNCCTPDLSYDFQGLRDFDAYQLGRDRDYYTAFVAWKRRTLVPACITLPSKGTVLSLHRTEPIPRKLLPWRCYEGYAPIQLPEHIARSVCPTRRPRNSSLREDLLKFNTVPLSFQVVARLTGSEFKMGENVGWFHLYVGCLGGTDGGLLCLKVFDERLFHVELPKGDCFDVEKYPDVPALKSIRHADSLMRAEEAAYSRLKKYQGSLVPHFYGCVEVELPGGYIALGILTEYIEGVSIGYLLSAVRSSWTHEEQAKLYSRMRRALQVLKAHRISDDDASNIHFLCVPRLDPKAADRADAVDLVMNNFAFTKQPWAPTHLLPGSENVQGFAELLELSDEMKAETGWLPEHRERYEF